MIGVESVALKNLQRGEKMRIAIDASCTEQSTYSRKVSWLLCSQTPAAEVRSDAGWFDHVIRFVPQVPIRQLTNNGRNFPAAAAQPISMAEHSFQSPWQNTRRKKMGREGGER